MSKPADATKLERIQHAAISIISEQGITNCSVAAIAKRAGVSIGYLYLHYPGKDALINDMLAAYFNLISDRISELIRENRSLEYVVEGVIRSIVGNSADDEGKIRFLIMLLNDFSVAVDPQLKTRIDRLIDELIRIARQSDTIRPDLTKTDLFLAMIGMPMQYLALRHNKFLHPGDEVIADVEHITLLAKRLINKS